MQISKYRIIVTKYKITGWHIRVPRSQCCESEHLRARVSANRTGRPDLEQNGSRVFRANSVKFIASSCFRAVDSRYARSLVLSRSGSRVLQIMQIIFLDTLYLRLLNDSISRVLTVKRHRFVERGSKDVLFRCVKE